MNAWGSLLPATAVVAVLLFIARETLEYFRRRGADKRKVSALTHLLARECELNYWAIKALRYIAIQIPTDENPGEGMQVTIERKPSGRSYARIVSADGGTESHHPVPRVHRELMSKFLLDVATIDRELFVVMEPAYDALSHLEHVRESFVNAPEASDFIGQDGYLEGLAGFALDELLKAEDKIGRLYRHCTGNELTKHRVR
ncbi:hypothetical protein [Pelomonas sp. KK5]|uniref:hypothetical protein n=1 Tax=Pelomonas sp. KK5 TaxID=1855730 RepID=UPI001301D43F|nr:hypothetical protein [Pelomonas sp. KK5]